MTKVHMIGNGHLDVVWLWPHNEGMQEIKATFSSALDRLKEDQDFILTSSSASYYEWIFENNPKMFKEIQKYVKEGRWRIVGGWWIQPDCNLPSGESFVRQGLYGQRFFKEHFGKYATVGYNVDSFGHNIILPQILKKSGLNSYVFMRPMPNEKKIPSHIFNWTSRDNSSVKAFRILYEYLSSPEDIEFHIRRCKAQALDNQEIMSFYGVGNHGGGPTKKNLKTINRLREEWGSETIDFSHPEAFFDGAKEPTVSLHDELQYHAKGCFSALSKTKEQNKKTEVKLFQGEFMDVLRNRLFSEQVKNSNLEKAWKNVLFNQFHDILPGTSIPSAYKYVDALYGEANAIVEREINHTSQLISWGIDIPYLDNVQPFVIFNMSQVELPQLVELEIAMTHGEYQVVDLEGNLFDTQIVQSEAIVDKSVHWRGKVAFIDTIPAFGYKTYYLKKLGNKSISTKPLDKFVLENENITVQFNQDTGSITSIKDKKSGVNFIGSEGISLKLYEDYTDTWAHSTATLGDKELELEFSKIYFKDSGSVKNEIFVEYKYKGSLAVISYSLTKGMKFISAKIVTKWNVPHTLLRLSLDINVNFPNTIADMTYGYIDRECFGLEEFYHKFVGIEGLHKEELSTSGIFVSTDSRYSYRSKHNLLEVLMLRNVPYSFHDPAILKDEEYRCIDEGYLETKVIIYPYIEQAWKETEIIDRSIALQTKLRPQIETFHKGDLPSSNGFIKNIPQGVLLSSIKHAEDSDEIIIRVSEVIGNHVDFSLEVMSIQTNEINLKPFEVKTLLILKNGEIKELNMLEEEVE